MIQTVALLQLGLLTAETPWPEDDVNDDTSLLSRSKKHARQLAKGILRDWVANYDRLTAAVRNSFSALLTEPTPSKINALTKFALETTDVIRHLRRLVDQEDFYGAQICGIAQTLLDRWVPTLQGDGGVTSVVLSQ
ncbi:hypothetical protein CERSUDRAFT_96528 [Gelatoporia subvermispora B]|uniref:Uncharacterized protein n=1 Tax=Ceriporiopsis subvermispora (strain B) TaxID=914234 RepID=M2RAG2_CERS8|nr:hypothetical protein CERSUDRAFT_96528 [Gelatoporia subvermispora B]